MNKGQPPYGAAGSIFRIIRVPEEFGSPDPLAMVLAYLRRDTPHWETLQDLARLELTVRCETKFTEPNEQWCRATIICPSVGAQDLRFLFRSLLHLSGGNGKREGEDNHDVKAD